jgi:hypothetical protein
MVLYDGIIDRHRLDTNADPGINKENEMATILTPTELAELLETSPRTARKFLRAITPLEEQPGKGGRWQIKKGDVRSFKKKFAEYSEVHIRTVEVPNDDVPETDDELYAELDAE